MYTIAGQIYGDPEDDEYGDLDTEDETRYRLNQLGLGEKARFKYEYDFGDSWHHTILVEKILAPPLQVVFLFSYWITACDWAFTYRMAELADGMLTAFKVSALTNLSALPVGQSMPFEPFAERVIAGSRLQWSHPDESYVQMLKHRLVEQVLIDPMTRFGVLECGYRPNKILGGDYKDLETMSLTAAGRSLLTLLKESP